MNTSKRLFEPINIQIQKGMLFLDVNKQKQTSKGNLAEVIRVPGSGYGDLSESRALQTLMPGQWAKKASGLWEWYSDPWPTQPHGARIVSLPQSNRSPER